MIFDTHTHSYFEVLATRKEAVQENMLAAGVTHCVQIGCNIPSSRDAIQLARKFPNSYASVGFHPTDAQNPALIKDRSGIGENNSYNESYDRISYEKWLREIIEQNRDIVVALWETGLDFYHMSEDPSERAKELAEQYYWFERFAALWKEYSLPLIIHSRNARQETLDCIKKFNITSAVIHCFSEDSGFARELMEFSNDIYFSFSGILTYKKSLEVQETAKILPLDKILVETDSPFLAPQSVRGEVNEPAYTRYTLETLCSLRSESKEEVEKRVFENSLRFYGVV